MNRRKALNIIVSGGGTGGHISPALEVARVALEQGYRVRYLGSQRGPEKDHAEAAGFSFVGFPSEPIYNLKSVQGVASALKIWRSVGLCRKYLKNDRPDAILCTGGYATAPVVTAARLEHIPYVIHEQNTIPGRTNRMLASHAFAVGTTFRRIAKEFNHANVVRVGMPIRKATRFAQPMPGDGSYRVMVFGGSQGAAAINKVVLDLITERGDLGIRWMLVAGKKNYESVRDAVQHLTTDRVQVADFLTAEEMGAAFASSDVVICRSGGSLAEVAAHRKPSILIPYPNAMNNHQFFNAQEFVQMGASTLLEESMISADALFESLEHWRNEPQANETARLALEEWDLPDAANALLNLLKEAVQSKSKASRKS